MLFVSIQGGGLGILTCQSLYQFSGAKSLRGKSCGIMKFGDVQNVSVCGVLQDVISGKECV